MKPCDVRLNPKLFAFPSHANGMNPVLLLDATLL